jgi:hypothetical protein
LPHHSHTTGAGVATDDSRLGESIVHFLHIASLAQLACGFCTTRLL